MTKSQLSSIKIKSKTSKFQKDNWVHRYNVVDIAMYIYIYIILFKSLSLIEIMIIESICLRVKDVDLHIIEMHVYLLKLV